MIRNDNYCLQRNEFEGNVKIYWQKFQTDNDFCDVTLVCEDKQIKPHKLIISSFSPVLRNILKLNQAPHPSWMMMKYLSPKNIFPAFLNDTKEEENVMEKT